MAEPEVTPENLAELTEEMVNNENPEAATDAPSIPDEGTDEGETPRETPVEQEAQPEGQSEETFKDRFGVPFESEEALAKGYKNLQREFTERNGKVKPYENIIDRMNADPQFAGLVNQALQVMDNPGMLQAYANQGKAGDPQPNPANYEIYTAEGLKKYQDDHDSWIQRNMDQRFNTLKQEVEQNARLDNHRREFKGKFTDVENPDELLQWANQNGPRMNPYEAAYKLRNWDNMQSSVEAKVRKELAGKMQDATKKTPQGTSAKTEANATEIIQSIGKYGLRATSKRYGEAVVTKALQTQTV